MNSGAVLEKKYAPGIKVHATMNEFEGIGTFEGKTKYDTLLLSEAFRIYYSNHCYMIGLLIIRGSKDEQYGMPFINLSNLKKE